MFHFHLAVLLYCAAISGWTTGRILTAPDGRQYRSGVLAVKLKPELHNLVSPDCGLFGVPALDRLNHKYGVSDVSPLVRSPRLRARKHGCELTYILRFDPGQDVFAAKAAYESSGLIEYAEPDYMLPVVAVPNDTLYPLQWHLARIGAPYAWDVFRGDTSVLIAVLDLGCEWHHPDVENNLWVNIPEDLNGNRRFDTLPAPEGDIDSVDQDSNGYADDVIGYDLFLSDPNPAPIRPEDDHGTHCWGIANAVTDNYKGVAGVPWNCRSFAFSCGAYGLISQLAAAAGIYYAIDKGAWAISMSFGTYNTSPVMAEACSLAWDAGLVLIGGAGNDGQNRRFYPADYPKVISVAASDQTDRKTWWSNYGEWIEVCAPGTGIYSTVTNHGYGSKDGTSMATPVVTGALAWLKSAYPELTNVQACSLLYACCDSMPDSLYRAGMLGAGRLSLSRIILPRYYCDLVLTDVRFNDASGNGNGRPDPGETTAVIVTYHNTLGWQDATGVTAYLACGQPGVELLKPEASFPDIAAGSSGNCSADSFVVSVSDTTPPQHLLFSLTVTASPEPAFPDTEFQVVCGEPRILIVDDDNGADYEKWYAAAFDSSGVLYHLYSIRASGSPTAETLRHYPVVVWFCGDDSVTTLTAADRTALAEFLDAGGNLLISGQSIAQNLKSESFLADYLRAQLADSSTGKPYLPGIPEDPITRGDTMVTGGGGGANNGRSLDGIRPANHGIGCSRFRDYPDTTVMSAIRYAGTYRLVFFSIPFEAIDHAVSRYVQKWTLVRRILEWFGERLPGVVEAPPPIRDGRPYALRITPNPFTQNAEVEFIAPTTGIAELRTYSISGRLVEKQQQPVRLGGRTRFLLGTPPLAPGVYLVQLVTADGAFRHKAVVVR